MILHHMKQVTWLSPDDQTVRTQVTLTKKLKTFTEANADNKGQPLSESLRHAAIKQLVLDQEKDPDLKQLAAEVVGSVD